MVVAKVFLWFGRALLMNPIGIATTEQIVSLTLATAVGDIDRQEIARFLENNTQRLK